MTARGAGARTAEGPGPDGEPALRRRAAKSHQVGAALGCGAQQLVHVDRRSGPGDALAERRQHADGDVAQARIVLERAPELGAGDAGALDIDEKRARTDAEGHELQSGPAMACAQHVHPGRRQMVAELVARLALVVDQDDGVTMAPHASPSIGISTNEDKGSVRELYLPKSCARRSGFICRERSCP